MNARLTALIAVVAATAGAGAWWLHERTTAPPPAPSPPAAITTLALSAPVGKVVESVPDFKLADRSGEMRSLADYGDKALIVNFWATWCAPCRREIPLLQSIQKEHGPEGFQVVGIAVDFREQVLAYAAEMNIDYPVLIGEQDALDAAASFGVDVQGFPFTVFTDRHRRVVAVHVGELHLDQTDAILAVVRRVNAGKLTPTQARAVISRQLSTLRPASTGDPG